MTIKSNKFERVSVSMAKIDSADGWVFETAVIRDGKFIWRMKANTRHLAEVDFKMMCKWFTNPF